MTKSQWDRLFKLAETRCAGEMTNERAQAWTRLWNHLWWSEQYASLNDGTIR